MDARRFYEVLVHAFNLDDLRVLSFQLQLDFDTLRGEGKEAKIADLLLRLEQAGLLRDLERALRELRPHLLLTNPTTDHAPYVGLRTFQEADAALFYGRERLVETLVERLAAAPFLAVLGPSGSGKSSVVLAGLLPALKSGAVPGSARWRYGVFKPGARPLDALAAALTEATGGGIGEVLAVRQALADEEQALLVAADLLHAREPETGLLLVIDQFEELWTQAPTEADAPKGYAQVVQHPFIRLLLAGIQAGGAGPLRVVVTLRADFLHRAAEVPALARAVQNHLVLVSPMEPDELRRAVVQPARAGDGVFEPGLVEELVGQVVGNEGALPLLEYTLLELWQARDAQGTLTWQAYRRLGGVEGALAARAEAVLATYSDEERRDLRHLLLRLVQPGEGVADTRRRVPLADLVPHQAGPETVQTLLQPLVAARLLTTGRNPITGEEHVEVSHEALLRVWPSLAGWVVEAREDLRLHHQLETAAQDWEKNGEPDGLLWRELALARSDGWLLRARPTLNAREARFLEVSRAHEQARLAAQAAARQERQHLLEARAAAARRNILRLLIYAASLTVLVLLLALVVRRERDSRSRAEGATTVALEAGRRADIQAQRATAQGYAGEALFDLSQHDLNHALLLTLSAARVTPQSNPLVSRAIRSLMDESGLQRVFNAGGWMLFVNAVAWSPDGQYLAAGGTNDRIWVWQVETGQVLWLPNEPLRLEVPRGVQALAWSPDGQQIASGGEDGWVKVWDVQALSMRNALDAHPGGVGAIAWQPSGELIATGGGDGQILLWDSSSVQALDKLEGHHGAIRSLVWSPDGGEIMAGGEDGVVRIWSMSTRQLESILEGHEGRIRSLAWSPNGQHIVVAGDGPSVEVWDRVAEKIVHRLGGHYRAVWAVAWSPDGTLLATGGRDRTISFWAFARGESFKVQELQSHQSDVHSMSWSPDGQQLATGGGDGTAHLRDVATGQLAHLLTDEAGGSEPAVWSPDGAYIAQGGRDGAVMLWKATTGQLAHRLPGHQGSITSILWSPDGQGVVTAGHEGSMRFWEVATGELLQVLQTATGPIHAMTWNSEGHQVLLVNERGEIQSWDVRSGQTQPFREAQQGKRGVQVWSPDGQRVAIGGIDGTLGVQDVRTGESAHWSDQHRSRVLGLAWSPDGSKVVSGSFDGTARVWEVETGRVLYTLSGHDVYVTAVAWSPDGTLVATGGQDGTVRLWEATTGQEIRALERHFGTVHAIAWSPDGNLLATVGPEGALYLWFAEDAPLLAHLTSLTCDLMPNESIQEVILDWQGCEAELAAVADDLALYHQLRGK